MDAKEGGLGVRRPLSKEQIARRTMSREEVAMWAAQTKREETVYLHYWESKEVIPVTEVGDDYLVFVGRRDTMTAKIWMVMDNSVPHNAYILRPQKGTRYDLSEKEGVLLRFQFAGELRIFNKNGLKAVIDEPEMNVFQKGDDVIIRIEKEKSLP